ncbi:MULTISPECIES: ABC transporter ATP-binding protein [Crateriforma]|uniref:Putative ABC transporter ATP-binding protein YxlF n=1 Tax=Crateriforma conspicua TaxID=2527996 RepID=A0A5C6FXI4_9PLAN|nr:MULTISPECIES: ABC transporter ATP-binding protein [Crateriforma]QDV62978.1 putative ABC transporter ATP-binding protein YxlF [Crateriforma conspicua]TWT68249.1 putative ABC transporter ATP-binding protein YxlF [Crateriforma conspicua]TWU67717.1 putative ABC transporter ATP-binding protein YxlF [Crateriforma conspicua]
MTETPAEQASSEPTTAAKRPMIEAIGLSKFYGPFAASRDITFSVGEGELVAFLGPNGAGKSTTMKMLTGYIAPSEGVAKIAGHNMMEDRIAGSRRLGYLPESGPLYYEMTPMAMLSFFADARGLSSAIKKDRIDKVVDICDLSTVMYKPISKLSKGFKQRVGMSQALLHEPDVLILDEPTAGLDPNQIRGVRKTMRRLSETKTILLSTHILQEVEAMADRVVLINEGRMRYDGSVEGLRQRGDGDLDDAFHSLTLGEAMEPSET